MKLINIKLQIALITNYGSKFGAKSGDFVQRGLLTINSAFKLVFSIHLNLLKP